MQAHEREQLREAGQRKMSELRSLKAAVLKAHAAAKLQQQHSGSRVSSEGSVSSTYLTSDPSYESESSQALQQQPGSLTQSQQQFAQASHLLVFNPQDAKTQTVTTSSCSRDRPVSTPGSTAVKGTVGLGLCHSAPGSLGFLQPGSFGTVARAAGAVAAGAAAVAAAAAARAGAADPPAGPMDEDTAVSPATGPLVMQQQVEMQQAQQSTVQQVQQVTPQDMQMQAQEQQPAQQQEQQQQELPSVPDVSFQDPMVDMLLQQVGYGREWKSTVAWGGGS